MRPLRAIIPMLRKESPVTLAREAVWRMWKPYRSRRLLATIRRGDARLKFLNVPFYRPDVKRIDAASASVICAVADLVCVGRFPLLGYPIVDLGFPPRWNRDFISGFEWEELPVAQLGSVVRHNGSDVKIPWDLSRLQFLPVLAKAHLLSKNNRYREAAKTLLLDWLTKNPVGMGVNWTLAMESALRGMSLCFTLSLLQPLRLDEQDWGHAVTHSIWEHLLYTEAALEFSHVIRSNHYLGNIVGLLCMSTFLDGPEMKQRRWLYQTRVEDEILRQVHKDGGDYEASLGYHVLVLQMFTTAFLLIRAAGCEPNREFTERVSQMHKFLATIADKQGCVPHVGDCDDGRTEIMIDDLKQMIDLPLEKRNSLRVSSLLGLGDALFSTGRSIGAGDLVWYGLDAPKIKECRPNLAVFPTSGLAVARKGETEVVLCAIPNGIHGRGSHTHNDKLSIVARLGDEELFCDSGTFVYTRDVAVRNRYRSTAAHNTLMIDEQEQNTINVDRQFAFCIGNEAQVSRIDVQESDKEICISASHSGYSRIGVEHQRKVRVSAHGFTVEDDLEGTGEHSFEGHWHIPSSWRVLNTEDGFLIHGLRQVRLIVTAATPVVREQAPTRISRTYGGATESGIVLTIKGRAQLPCVITTNVTWE